MPGVNPRTSRLPARAVLAAAAVLVSALAAGCAGSAGAKPDPQPALSMPRTCAGSGPVVFVVSGRRDSPAPALTGMMAAAAWAAIRDGSPIGLIDLDGKPRLTAAGEFSDPGANPAALANEQQSYFTALAAAVARTRARRQHADVLDALDLAGRAVRAACGHGGTVYLEDSGLAETGPVDFRRPGMLTAAPGDVVAFLRGQRELPSLSGIKVVYAGLGDVAPPQAQPSIAQRASLVAIWTAIAEAGGAASVTIDPAPRSGVVAPRGVPEVLLVPLPAGQAWDQRDARFVFPDSGPVGFLPNSAGFRDPAAAMAALRPIARYLVANPSARIELTGTTARWGSLAGAVALGARRAAAVESTLVRLGALPAQIATRGVGWRFAGYENDRGPGGVMLPGPAEHNRSVIVTRQ